jgi:hypothetical protein
VRSRAQINEIATFVSSNATIVRNFARDKRNLEGVIAEKLEGLFLAQDKAVELLSSLNNLLGAVLNLLVVFLIENLFTLNKPGILTSTPV